MARVDFYVLSQSGEQAQHLFACRLAEKAYRLDNTVLILTQDRATAERIDELLWTFRDGSFVPHHLARSGTDMGKSPVTISSESMDVEAKDLLINLGDEIPDCAGAFPRIAELVTSDETSKQKSRRRFSTYRDRGHRLDTHKV
jgi:DNA polymerase-3 subunit chi